MEIVTYPHPALRWKSTDVKRIDAPLRAVIRRMFDLMYAANGIGLAANQVALPFRFFVANLTGEASETDEELVFINPQIVKRRGGTAVAEEGCLSLPGLFADVKRSSAVTVEAFDLEGQLFRADLTELGARAVQHEIDHLDGILFIDRLEESVREQVSPKVAQFLAEHARRLGMGEIPDDDEVRTQLKQLAEGNGDLSNVG